MKALFISPHPDDVEIGCGGLMYKMSKAGHTVDIAVVCGSGTLAMASGSKVSWTTRMDEQKKAAEVLKVSNIHWLNFASASNFDQQPISKLVTALDAVLREGYDEIYIPLPSHAKDHNVVWEACTAALRPTKAEGASVYAYEQPTQYHGPQLGFAINCTRYVGLVSEDLEAKLAAYACHASQVSGREKSIVGYDGLVTLAKTRGLQMGKGIAEAYVPIRIIDKELP
jgi:LmbE family N-acetylglucosaminyl deacetylase